LKTGIYTFGMDVTIGSDITFQGTDTNIFIIQIAGMKVNLMGSTFL
jgi:hypothetical protein